MNAYRHRIWDQIHPLLQQYGPFESALDFGSGDGWFARQVSTSGVVHGLTAVDVKRRDQVHFEPQLYAGGVLPFPDQSFRLVYAIDVLHHCADPLFQLRELARCCAGMLLIKDHTYRTVVGRVTLAVLDEVGNRRFGIPSLYAYQRGDEWRSVLEQAGMRRVYQLSPMNCHVGVLGALTNSLQCLSVYARNPD